MSSVRRILRTAAASRAAARHSARPVRDSRGRARHREHVRDSREPARRREPARQENVRYALRDRCRVPARQARDVRQEKTDRQESVRCARRDRHRVSARQVRGVLQEKADQPESVRRVLKDRRRVPARQEKSGRQETARHAQRDRHRDAPQEKADRRETVQCVLTVRYALTDLREDVLSAKEDRDARTEVKEADAIRDRAVQDRAETGEIPAGKIWELRS